MLASLSIRDIVLIDRLDLDLSRGLCVLTGETGAGKSILLDALGLATGSRADKNLVRHGSQEGSATALFEVPARHQALTRLQEADLLEDGETSVILRRAQRADGPSRAFINDRPVSVGLLQEIGGLLLEVHGQNDARGLLDASGHRALLDAFGGLAKDVAKVATAFGKMESAATALADQKARIDKDAADTEYLAHIIGELEQLDPEPGEEDSLAADRTQAMNAEKIADDLKEADKALSAGGGLEARAGKALRRLERIQEQAGGILSPVIESLSRMLDEAADASRHLDSAVASLSFDQGELDDLEERLFALRAAARKHQCRVDQLPEILEDARARLEAVSNATHRLAELEKEAKETAAQFEKSASELTAKRTKAALRLDKTVIRELVPLKLEKARFKTALEPASAGPAGADKVLFTVSTNPGAPFGALTRVASGGEMSRFVLALKVALAEVGTAPTLIFDEIDQGVGGAVAGAIGDRLSALSDASGAQIIVVTHSPQIAAKGQTHWLISKSIIEGQALTRVVTLTNEERREEIARMLSAAEITDEARAAASQLLSGQKGPSGTLVDA